MAIEQQSPACLARLGNETLTRILKDPGLNTGDIAAFAATSKKNHALGNPILYKKHVQEEGGVVFVWAVHHQNIGTLERLVENGADVNRTMATASMQYCLQRYRWVFPILRRKWLYEYYLGYARLDNNPRRFEMSPAPWDDPSTIGQCCFHPLALAAAKGRLEAATWLLDHGARPDKLCHGLCDCKDESYWCYRGQQPPRPMRIDRYGWPMVPRWTALHFAIHHGQEAVARLLLSRGADARCVNSARNDPCTALHSAAMYCDHHKLIIDILEGGYVDVNERGCGGCTLLHIALFEHDYELVNIALRYGADVNVEYTFDIYRVTPLAVALSRMNLDLAQKFLSRGAKVGFTAIFCNGILNYRCTVLNLLNGAEHQARLASAAFQQKFKDIRDDIHRRLQLESRVAGPVSQP